MRFSFTLIAIAVLVTPFANAGEKAYQAPRLANGQPDFQGNWDHSNSTPLSRLKGFTSLAISAEQAAVIDNIVRKFYVEMEGPNDPDNALAKRQVEPIRGQFRSSLIVDPPDGMLPGTPALVAWMKEARGSVLDAMDGPEQRPISERCIADSAALAPILYNPGMNLHQIVQANDVVLIHSEIMHDARVIRLNADHVPAAVTSWLGDSIGWWDGDTLVVQTKHFTPSDTGRGAPFASYRLSPQATVTERFTRVSAKQLDYSFTVEDPVYYTQPWTGESQFMQSDDPIYEYACHEGNYSLAFILYAARVNEASKQASERAARQ